MSKRPRTSNEQWDIDSDIQQSEEGCEPLNTSPRELLAGAAGGDPDAGSMPPESAPEGLSLKMFEEMTVTQPAALRCRPWDTESLSALVAEMQTEWHFDSDMLLPAGALEWSCTRFGIPTADLVLASNAVNGESENHISRKMLRKWGVISTLLELAFNEDYVPDEADSQDMYQKLGSVACLINNASNLVNSNCKLMCTGTHDSHSADPYLLGNKFLHLITDTKLLPIQALLIDLSNVLMANKWRQYNGNAYKPITVVIDNVSCDTHAWELMGTIEEMIVSLCNCNMDHKRWLQLTSAPGILRQAATQLMVQGPWSFEFPLLKFDRRLFAFTDGCYDAENDKFYPHTSRDLPNTRVAIKFFDHPFGPFASDDAQEGMHTPHDKVSPQFVLAHVEDLALVLTRDQGVSLTNFLEQSLIEQSSFRSIDQWIYDWLKTTGQLSAENPWMFVQHVSVEIWKLYRNADHLAQATPLVDSLFFTQGYDLHTMSAAYAMLGKLMYEVNEADRWQVIPFLIGKAGTGKSILIRLVRHLYPAACVANLSNNAEVKFGLSAIYGKLMFLCPEVKKSFAVDQADFHSMVSGEEVSIAIKNHTAQTHPWTAPGLMAGNEAFGFEDTANSLYRRVVAMYFNVFVPEAQKNTMMFEQITQGTDEKSAEFGAFIRKTNRCYQVMVRASGTNDFWDTSLVDRGVVSPALHTFRTAFRKAIDTVVAFVDESNHIERSPDCCVSFKLFEQLYAEYVTNGHAVRSRVRVPKDKLEALGLEVVSSVPVGYVLSGVADNAPVVLGCKYIE
jgi:hypothetical protein